MKNFFKKFIPAKTWRQLRFNYYSFRLISKPKVFCISMQRNGTTSCGNFLKDHGYRVAGYGEHSSVWSKLWFKGDYDKIFKSKEFKSYQGFEDNPWWFPDFYRVLNSKFPKAKFILLHRDPDKWFDSMLNHLEIKTLTNNYDHSKIYRKLDLFYGKLDNDPNFKPNIYDIENLIPFEQMREHYIKVYQEYNREAIEYFKNYAPTKLFVTDLEDNEKWKKLGVFLDLKVSDGYNMHIRSPK